MTKKLLLLAAAFVLAIVAECSKSPAPSSGDAKGSPTPSASGREGSGVTLEPVSVATNDPTEAYNKLFATKDLPDLMFFSNYDLPNKYGGDGALVNLLDHAAKMPNMTKWLHSVSYRLVRIERCPGPKAARQQPINATIAQRYGAKNVGSDNNLS
ncbi:hypothetical protein [Paenibacillus cymbidii]|uniref:hypothetical protein n=1 Tax=Paenibacillus cymbidii TaxID=1639034 RepID=UPI0010804A7A|nr:hypothetical protein [Paenibacillus cymbidii]